MDFSHDPSRVAAAKLSAHPNLKEERGSGDLWLRRVEVRAVLDEGEWNSATWTPYGFIETRRAWIVRDNVGDRAKEELCGCIARVTNVYRQFFVFRALNDDQLEMLRSLLLALVTDDRIKILRHDLTDEAVAFLIELRAKWRTDIRMV